MKEFRCEYCKYTTNVSSNFHKHNRTLKHKRNVETYKQMKENMVVKSCIKIENTNLTTNDHNLTTKVSNLTTNDHNLTTNDHNLTTKVFKPKHGFECEYCHKILSTKGHLSRHIKNYCLIYKKMDNNKILESKLDNFTELIKNQESKHETEKKELYKQMEILLNKVGNTTNIQTNIHLNSYGSEDLSHISDKFKNELIKIPFGMIPKMIEAVHFNENKPENKNIVLPNKKENRVKVFTNNKWVWQNKDETISALVDGKYYIMESHFDEVSNNLSPFIRTNFLKFKEFFNENDKELVENLKKKCELILLNNR